MVPPENYWIVLLYISMGWKPIISIEKGLKETLEWYKKNIK